MITNHDRKKKNIVGSQPLDNDVNMILRLY